MSTSGMAAFTSILNMTLAHTEGRSHEMRHCRFPNHVSPSRR